MKNTLSLPLAALLLLTLSLLALLMLASILYALHSSRVLTGDATAINQAGSLRMQSYKIAQAIALQQQDDEISRLRSELNGILESSELNRAIPDNQLHPITLSFQAITDRWSTLQQLTISDPIQYLSEVDNFVDQLHSLVFALEDRSEKTVNALYRNQAIAMFGFLFIFSAFAFLIMYRLVKPLSLLKNTAQAISSGDLERRSNYRFKDELGVLSQSLDQMADHLVETNTTLEQRVMQQTRLLQRKTDTLAFLFDLSRTLSQNTYALPRLFQSQTTALASVADLSEVRWSDQPLYSNDEFHHGVQLGNSDTWLVICGVHPLEDWQRQLAETCCELFESAQERLLQQKNAHRLTLLEERSSLARELHDSLAQSLSYLKMLVAKWYKLNQKSGQEERMLDVIKDIEAGLSSAYRRLRELLVTFRMRPEHNDLSSAITASIEEFSQSTSTIFNLHIDPEWPELTANQEMHCLHIVREALNNIIKHAQASRVNLSLEKNSQECLIRVQDDGIGLPNLPDSMEHFGLGIMIERSHRIGGHCLVNRLSEGGTEVLLKFPVDPKTVSEEA